MTRTPDRFAALSKEHNKIGSEWLGPESCCAAGPSEQTVQAGASADTVEPCDMDCTSDTQEERIMLSRLGPKRKPRRRSIPLRNYDQMVALAEANAQKKHDAIHGPSMGAAPDVSPLTIDVSKAATATVQQDLHAMD